MTDEVQESVESSPDIIDEAFAPAAEEPKVEKAVEEKVEEKSEAKPEKEGEVEDAGEEGSVEEDTETEPDSIEQAWEEQFGDKEVEEVSEEQPGDVKDVVEETRSDDENVISAVVEGVDGAEDVEYEIPKDAKITVKVDGVEQLVSLQEVANGISGQKAIAQKFSALDAEKKSFDNRLSIWNDSSAKAIELMNENKAVEAIEHAAEMMGFDPKQLFTTLFSEITPILDDYANMSEADRKVWAQDLNSKKAEFKAESAQKELKKLQAEKEQLSKVNQVREAHGLDQATFTMSHKALEAEMEAGTLNKQPITPELVGEYTRLVRIEGYAADSLVGSKHEGDPAAINQVLQAVNIMARDGVEITGESVKAIVQEALGREAQVEKSKTVQKSLKKKGVKPKAKGGKKPKQMNRSNPEDSPKNWMVRAMEDLDDGKSLSDLGLKKS